MLSTTALDQSSIGLSENFVFDQSELDDVKSEPMGSSGFLSVRYLTRRFHFLSTLQWERGRVFRRGPRDLASGAGSRGGSPAIPGRGVRSSWLACLTGIALPSCRSPSSW
jgi:hypothetical protein